MIVYTVARLPSEFNATYHVSLITQLVFSSCIRFQALHTLLSFAQERTKNAQFVIISLRNNMFEMADRLVGIYKTYDVTKSVTVDPRRFPSPAEALKERNA